MIYFDFYMCISFYSRSLSGYINLGMFVSVPMVEVVSVRLANIVLIRVG